MIVYNAIGCKHCLQVIESLHRHDFRTCSCGSVSVDGGNEYLRRLYNSPNDYYELSIDSEQPFEIVRQFAYRTGYGKLGTPDYGTFRRTILNEMTDDHLQAALDYVYLTHGYNRHWSLLLEEKLYRSEREIYIPENLLENTSNLLLETNV